MGEVVNLRAARKARSRTERDNQAAANRARFGEPAAERKRKEAAERLLTERHEGHRLSADPDAPGRP